MQFEDVLEVFCYNKITEDVLIELSNDEMKELGIVALGDRIRLRKVIAHITDVSPEDHAASSSNVDHGDETDLDAQVSQLVIELISVGSEPQRLYRVR